MKFANDIIEEIKERGTINTVGCVTGEDFEKFLRGVKYKYIIDKNVSFIVFNDTLKNIVGKENLVSYDDNWFIVKKKLTKRQINDLELGVKIINIMEVYK